MNEKTVESSRKLQTDPEAPEFSEAVRNMRTQLLIVSCISIAVAFGVEPDMTKPQLGMSFKNFDSASVQIALLIVNSYILLHFFWCTVDDFLLWGVRLTGLHAQGAFPNIPNSIDHWADHRGATLYGWWVQQSKNMVHWQKVEADLKSAFEKIHASVQGLSEKPQGEEYLRVLNSITDVHNQVNCVTSTIERVGIVLQSKRVPLALAKFEQMHRHLLCSQAVRWATIEWGLPCAFAAYAVGQLLARFLSP